MGKKSKIIFDTAGEIYIENHGSIIKYTDKEIAFANKAQEINITGEEMYLQIIGEDYVQAQGRIKNIAVKEVR